MSRYLGPKQKLVRKLGNLPGLTTKTQDDSKGGKNKRGNISEYGLRLQEKQKLKFNYGVTEKQLFNYVKEARRLQGATGSNLLQLLEMRLDNIVYRLGFANTIPAARQLVTHGHIQVNGKKLTFPSFQCRPNDIVTVNTRKSSQNLVKSRLEQGINREIPKHLSFKKEEDLAVGTILSIVNARDIELRIRELLIVEFYSRKS